jgi:transcriptional repressor NrdR
MDELRNLDQVAYVRFASVYRNFTDVDAFADLIREVKTRPRGRPPSKRKTPTPVEDDLFRD